jgi:hypothetical protein
MGSVSFWVKKGFPTKTQRPQSLYTQLSFFGVLSALVGNKTDTNTLLSNVINGYYKR